MTIFENVAFGLRVRPRAQRLRESDIRDAGRNAARAGAARLARRPLSAPALRRPAPAHRAGARARRRAARAAARRAVRRARREGAPGTAPLAAAAARRSARDQRVRHARPGGGARGRRPRRRDEPRPHRADRHAGGGLRPSGDAVRRSSSWGTSTACRCPATRGRRRLRAAARDRRAGRACRRRAAGAPRPQRDDRAGRAARIRARAGRRGPSTSSCRATRRVRWRCARGDVAYPAPLASAPLRGQLRVSPASAGCGIIRGDDRRFVRSARRGMRRDALARRASPHRRCRFRFSASLRAPSATGSRKRSRVRRRRRRAACPTASGCPAARASRRRRPCWCRSSIARRTAGAADAAQRGPARPSRARSAFPAGASSPTTRRSPPRRCAKRPRKSACRATQVAVLGAARRLRNGDRLSRDADRRLGRAAVRADARSRSRSPTSSRCRWRSCSIPRISSGTSACWATLRRDFWAIPYGDRYIWGATAAMLLILDRTLRAD